jgi:hypothetical protein
VPDLALRSRQLDVGGPSTNATLLPLQRMLVQLAGTTMIGTPTFVADSFVERRFIRHCASQSEKRGRLGWPCPETEGPLPAPISVLFSVGGETWRRDGPSRPCADTGRIPHPPGD